ncbi:PQQ-like beta-propeller repeat protein [Candidatus Poribacteria bacterium]|nr:PQQ-like beta-propeller repeat protein [Candidatus Poribacteria bacterium]MBT7804147.1 PQQ-like beta-propeller repeat protein [Candidatus Poribacteria bacterium]
MHRRLRRRNGARASACVALAFACLVASAGDWPQWRGANRDGVSPERGLTTTWPEGGPPSLWTRAIGEGFSGVSIVGDRVYTMAGQGEDEVVLCLDALTGEDVWRVPIDRKFTEGHGNGPRSTPTVHDGAVYVLSAWGTLRAIDARYGDPIWEHDLREEYGGRSEASEPWRGYATSALVEDDLLVVEVGGPDGGAVMAFDRVSGEQRWAALSDPPAYSSPIGIEVDRLRQVVLLNGAAAVGLTLDGLEAWRYPWVTSYDQNVATPVFIAPNRVFISEGYDGKGAAMLEVADSGLREVWRSEVMRNDFGSCVLADGFLYGFDGTSLKCIDARDGAERWVKRGYGRGTLIAADDVLIVLGERGQLVVVAAQPDEYVEHAAVKQVIAGKCWTSPSLAHGRLYIRDEKTLIALDLRSGH